MTSLDNKVVVVTGAGRMRSIGRAICLEFARAGCQIVAAGSGRSRESLPDDEKTVGWTDVASVAGEINASGGHALSAAVDVTSEASVRQLHDAVIEEMGRVDIVVNNASFAVGQDRQAVIDLDPDYWRRVIDVNLTGAFLMSKVFGRSLVEQGTGGSIVNISSIAGRVFPANTAAYAASKAGVIALTGSMAREVGPSGIRVNAIVPGLIDTARVDGLGRGAKWDQVIRDLIPLGRAGTPEDVARLAVFLCCDEGSWITGQHYIVDGGRAIGH